MASEYNAEIGRKARAWRQRGSFNELLAAMTTVLLPGFEERGVDTAQLQ